MLPINMLNYLHNLYGLGRSVTQSKMKYFLAFSFELSSLLSLVCKQYLHFILHKISTHENGVVCQRHNTKDVY